MKQLGIVLIFSIFAVCVHAQSWTIVDDSAVPQTGLRYINPEVYTTAYVNDEEVRSILWSAPQELRFDPSRDPHTLINIMTADGSIEQFSIVQYQMMEADLAKDFDHIRTFHGLSTIKSTRRIRISYTDYGLRAVITDESGQTYIDHLQRGDKDHKIIYRRNAFLGNEDWTCDFEGAKERIKDSDSRGSRSGDCVFRSYRFAMTTTGEYSNFHGATSEADSSLVMSAVVVTVDRVNDVFEQDITSRLVLINNTADIFYYNAGTDPFSGSSAGSMISQNQTNTDAVIGSANYDLGHIVSTGGSGLASLGVICANGAKARGVTGIGTPEGDPFDIDYVAHEIGHQLGANHTQNNSCNRNGSTAMEPGSASTIMGYAGICSPNVQSNSDAYFHAISIQEMNAEITSNSCHGVISTSNVAPVADPLTNKSIPHSTPFVLDVNATDGNGNLDTLTYNWEQMDNEVGTMPPQGTNTVGPMFRSIFATEDSKRYFPNLVSLSTNTPFQWEVLPTVARDMDFRVTVRDHTFLPGCTDEQDITISVEGTAGPFVVTSQNTATTWLETQNATITWDVANTTAAPVSCANVDILLSYDSGLTYNDTLASNTINDGSHVIVVPVGVSNTARIMVKCSDNVFFDINDTDIDIQSGSPSYTIIANPNSGSTCDNNSIAYTLESTSILGYTTPITLSVVDLPSGANATISTNPLTPGNNTLITISNLTGQAGDYVVRTLGVSGIINRETDYNLSVQSPVAAPTLSSPADNATGTLTTPTLQWSPISGTLNYEYQVSTLPNGGNVVRSGSTTNTSALISPDLNAGTTYYWRVKSNNACGDTGWSTEWSFETGFCFTFNASDLPIAISSSGTPTITSTLNIKDKGTVNDLNVVGLTGTHTYISDLNFTLIAPDDAQRAFWSDPCNNQNNFNINFDDEAASSNYPCPPTDGGTYQPDNPLSFFDTKQMYGDWTLSVFDDFDADGGFLNTWGIEVCISNYCDLTVDNNTYVNQYGTLLSALSCAVDGDTIYLESDIANMTIDAGLNSIVFDKDLVIIADAADNIKLLSSNVSSSFIINSGKTVSFIGFDIENVNAASGVIVNNGTLTLRDVDLTFGAGKNSVVNNGVLGSLNVFGNCNFLEM